MNQAIGNSVNGLQFTMTGSRYVRNTVSVATSATAIPLASVTTPHWAYFKNLDDTNYLRIMNGSGGATLLKLLAGECAFCPLDDASTPYAIANTAACLLEYMILAL